MRRKNIILIGFMGTGKTTVGKIISSRMGCNFFDTDEEIENFTGTVISEIFRLKGEQYFREVEHEIIKKLSDYNGAVISCGGGVVKSKDNVECLKKNGLVVCLKAEPEAIYKRISCDESRPLAAGKTIEEIINLIKERENLYNIADVVVDTTSNNPEYAAQLILDAYMSSNQHMSG